MGTWRADAGDGPDLVPPQLSWAAPRNSWAGPQSAVSVSVAVWTLTHRAGGRSGSSSAWGIGGGPAGEPQQCPASSAPTRRSAAGFSGRTELGAESPVKAARRPERPPRQFPGLPSPSSHRRMSDTSLPSRAAHDTGPSAAACSCHKHGPGGREEGSAHVVCSSGGRRCVIWQVLRPAGSGRSWD